MARDPLDNIGVPEKIRHSTRETIRKKGPEQCAKLAIAAETRLAMAHEQGPTDYMPRNHYAAMWRLRHELLLRLAALQQGQFVQDEESWLFDMVQLIERPWMLNEKYIKRMERYGYETDCIDPT